MKIVQQLGNGTRMISPVYVTEMALVCPIDEFWSLQEVKNEQKNLLNYHGPLKQMITPFTSSQQSITMIFNHHFIQKFQIKLKNYSFQYFCLPIWLIILIKTLVGSFKKRGILRRSILAYQLENWQSTWIYIKNSAKR